MTIDEIKRTAMEMLKDPSLYEHFQGMEETIYSPDDEIAILPLNLIPEKFHTRFTVEDDRYFYNLPVACTGCGYISKKWRADWTEAREYNCRGTAEISSNTKICQNDDNGIDNEDSDEIDINQPTDTTYTCQECDNDVSADSLVIILPKEHIKLYNTKIKTDTKTKPKRRTAEQIFKDQWKGISTHPKMLYGDDGDLNDAYPKADIKDLEEENIL